MSEAKYIPELERWFVQHLTEKALDALYDSLSVQTMPEGRYDGRAWIYGYPAIGWLASLVWKGKVFDAHGPADGRRVRNRVLGMLVVRGWTSLLGRLCYHDGVPASGSELHILYSELGLTDTVRQVSPTLYLGRMQWRRWTVHFTLSQER